MPQRDSLTIRIEGDSGDGIVSLGMIAARTAARMGFHVYTYSTYLAVVRGGQSTFQLRLGRTPLLSQGDAPDILIALNGQAVHTHGRELASEGLVLHVPLGEPVEGDIAPAARALSVPFETIAIEETGQARAKNMAAAGALMQLIGLQPECSVEAMRAMFGKKDGEIAEINQRALQAGFDALADRAGEFSRLRIDPPAAAAPRMLLSGNEAVALGALVAGVRFFAGYPITPATEIMEWLAKHLPRVGGVMVQAEDEIASLAMCIGASYGGVKAMTATSGPGLSLMTELIGLAGMIETPIVIVDVQRAGPSTGMPTKEGQGDLNLAVYGVHGEVPRVVLAPKTVGECFEQTIQAVNIAHQFHIPVLLLSSQSLSHRMQTITPPDPESVRIHEEVLFQRAAAADPVQYARYADAADGAPSQRAVPGQPGGMHRVTGLEHDSLGNPSVDPGLRTHMIDRRRQRMKAIQKTLQDDPAADLWIEPGAQLGIVSWGATASSAREAADQLRAEGWKISHFFPTVLWPLPDVPIARFLASGLRQLFVCELNSTRQYAKMLRARYTLNLVEHGICVRGVTKDDGLPFTASQIRARILERVNEDIPRDFKSMRKHLFGDSPAAAGGVQGE